jgi:hypothetical protein
MCQWRNRLLGGIRWVEIESSTGTIDELLDNMHKRYLGFSAGFEKCAFGCTPATKRCS